MPVHQISVVPAKETSSNGRSAAKGKDKNKEENDKAPRRSGSRTSNISKASSSTTGIGHNGVSRASVTPSSQDICSSGALPALGEDVSEQAVPAATLIGGGPRGTKRLVKRRHRRKKEPCTVGQNLEGPLQPEDILAPRTRWERIWHHDGCPRETDSSSDEEEVQKWRQARSWSGERAKRARRPSGSSRQPRGSEERGDPRCSCVAPAQKPAGDAVKNRRRPLARREEPRAEPGCGDTPRKAQMLGIHLPSEGGDCEPTCCNQPDPGHDSKVTPPGGWSACQNGTMRHFTDDDLELCRICHCEGDEENPLITPCRCTGSLRFVHPDCLHQWIKSSDTRCCELCKYDFIMETQLKPLRKWEKLQMSTRERRQIFCSVSFHIIAVICVVWSLYVLIDRTAEEIKQGRESGVLEWPFWTKLIVVAIGFTGGLIFMYIQCKVYLQLWRRLKAYNRIIFVQNCPDSIKKAEEKTAPASQANGKHDCVEVPVPQTDANSYRPSADDAVPEVAPV